MMVQPVTNVQQLSMSRAADGIKKLNEHVAALNELGGMIGGLSDRMSENEVFRQTVTARVRSLREDARVLEGARWKGFGEQGKTLESAIGRVDHCSKAVIYKDRKKIIESCLAEAKDNLDRVISYLEVEAKRYPEEKPIAEIKNVETSPLELPSNSVNVTSVDQKEKTKFTDAINFKIPTPIGTVDPIKLFQWLKGLKR